jgi:hypothetical protein
MNSGVGFRWVGAFLLSFFILLGPSVLGQTGPGQEISAPPSATSSKPENNVCSLTGTVVNSVTGEPLRRAVVSLYDLSGNGQAGHAVLTDGTGRFEFDGLAEGRAFVSVMKPGFFDERNAPGSAPGIAVQVTRDASPIMVRMLPAGVITGRITTEDEQPLEGFQVHAITKQIVEGQAQWAHGQFQGNTNEEGEFRIAGLPPGKYYISVDQNQQTTLSKRGVQNPREQTYAQSYYPGVSDLGGAAVLELAAGREVEANFTLAPEPMYEIGGSVSAQGEGFSMLQFARKAGEASDFIQGAQMEDGRFQAKLLPGSYTVTAFAVNGARMTTTGPSVVVGSDNPDVHFALSLLPSIQVEVQAEHSGGSTEHGLPQQDGAPAMYLQLVPRSSFFRPRNFWRPAAGIQNVEPGIYSVEIATTGKWGVKSVQCGGVDLLSDDLTVAEGGQPPPIEVTLRDDAASVSGTVVQANDLAPATVLLVQPHGHRNLVKTLPAGDGKFDFQGVAPGDYQLLALDQADQLEYANPEILNAYLSKAIHINVQAHGTANLNLVVSPVGR